MFDSLKNILYLVPVMIYYFLESLIIAVFVKFAWRFVIEPSSGIEITYFQWVIIIWTIKVVFFDIFKMFASFGAVKIEKNNDDDKSDEK